MAKKTVPIHRHTWIYLLGGASLFLFGFQVATGCLLMLYYQPSESTAHESVQHIMTQVPYGWLIRSVHAWGASLFIGVVAPAFSYRPAEQGLSQTARVDLALRRADVGAGSGLWV